MAVEARSTADLLGNLTQALVSASTAFPSDEQTLLPPSDGISLLDVKNDLLLSYLQNLVFLIILRLRNSCGEADANNGNHNLDEKVIRKLVELRVYIERGVRPLEGRLRYQLDKVLRAAEEVERQNTRGSDSSNKGTKKHSSSKKRLNGTVQQDGSDVSNSASESAGSDDDESELGERKNDHNLEEILYRPNVRALAQTQTQTQTVGSSGRTQSKSAASQPSSRTGAYKPPRITPTAMPSASSAGEDHHSTGPASRRRKSNLLNEYIDEELSSAPKAQPSIGSNNTIVARGRSGFSARDREKEVERTEYEERNFVRLPGENKDDKRRARLRGERAPRDTFGGEDWTGLGGLGDRINRSVQLGKGSRAGLLERREKRARALDTKDGQRGDGMGIGESFTKRRKILEDRMERKRRKRG